MRRGRTLLLSAYSAAPGPKEGDLEHDIHDKLSRENEAETSTAMFMSGHFVFPPSEHENLPLEPEYSDIHNEKEGEYDVSQSIPEEDKSDLKDEENVCIEGLITDEFPGTSTFDEIGNRLTIHGRDFYNDIAVDKEQSIYITGEGERTDGTVEYNNHALNSSLQKPTDGDNNDDADRPCEAWWKGRVVSLYTHAKEANTFWSICIAAAFMGLAIIGHRWQQERWQILHHKWQSTIRDERMGMVLGQMFRLKRCDCW